MTTTDDESSGYSLSGGESSHADEDGSYFDAEHISTGIDDAAGETAVINHLLEVEKEAETMIASADAEANKRVGEYKAQAEAQFKVEYDALVAQMDSMYKQQVDAIQKAHDDEIAVYKQGIESIAPDSGAFNALVEKTLVDECALSGLPSSGLLMADEAYQGNRTMESA